MIDFVAVFVRAGIISRFLFALFLKDLNRPISHLVETAVNYCKVISVSGRLLNNQDTSIIGLITYIC